LCDLRLKHKINIPFWSLHIKPSQILNAIKALNSLLMRESAVYEIVSSKIIQSADFGFPLTKPL
ncbi:MAG: hypothetical protein WCF03_11005, partial [Nitrososphaeraceae archaeon]